MCQTDKRAVEDNSFEVAEKLPMMPREQVYSEAVRMYAVLRQKIKEYGYDDTSSMQAMEGQAHFSA